MFPDSDFLISISNERFSEVSFSETILDDV